ncbi:LOW QUALITY PROTEIN: hypothetical protein PHMEG_00024774 [Phytophthora megakarya]|uniref:Integrase catalytic domain-containing protein n=1 Tax=Phytophthora megakarya TaxID=4795 RepID=A0A225VCT0_9STRA|nr:LOW QUALITY PROTEIN: hypothetical protein PHMEG_00024774 [Phytophthora megakarya]
MNPRRKGENASSRDNRDGETHRKADCPKMKQDRSIGLVRTSIFVKDKIVEVPPKGKEGSKKRAKPISEEIPADVVQMQLISKGDVAAVMKGASQEPEPGYGTTLMSEQAQQDVDELMTSPPPSPAPSSSSRAMSYDQNDMNECEQGYFPSHSVKISEASSKIKEASMNIESTVRNLNPALLHRNVADVTHSDWVLDSGCGYGLTADATLFVRKQASEEFRFTFGEGTKLSNTHVGTVKLYCHGPDEIGLFERDNMALVPKAKANVLIVRAKPVKALHVPGHTRVEVTLKEWHIKLGHLNRDKVIEMMNSNLIPGVPNSSSKMLNVVALALRKKTEVQVKVKEPLLQLEREGKSTIKRIRSDGGTELVNAALKTFCTDMGVTFQTSNPYTPEENEAAERDHQTKMGKNSTPMRRLKNRTPYELVKGVSPDVKTLKVWGCVCFAYVPEAVRKDKKLSARTINQVGYIRYGDIITRSFMTDTEKLTSDEFNEIDSLGRVRHNEPSIPKVPIDKNKAQELSESVGVKLTKRRLAVAVGTKRRSRRKAATQDTTVERPKRDRKQKVRYGDYRCLQTHIDKTIAVDGIVKRISVPKSLSEALSGSQWKQWQEAFDLEYQSLLKNGALEAH